MTDKKIVGSVTYQNAGKDYFENRKLRRHARVWSLWALGVGAVISGHFSGWNFGIGVGGWGGLFIAALHHMGLATLTHTPSPMAFLSRLLGRPANEKPFILFPVGYPAPDAEVPDLRRKGLEEVSVWL